jgi:hypothetical protein
VLSKNGIDEKSEEKLLKGRKNERREKIGLTFKKKS